MEMRSLAKETGGLMVLCEGFEHEIFKKSIVKMFDKDSNDFLQMGFQATLEAIVRTCLIEFALKNDSANLSVVVLQRFENNGGHWFVRVCPQANVFYIRKRNGNRKHVSMEGGRNGP
jgi:protein transport protein SEC23